VGEVDPVALPDALHLELEQFGIGEHGPVDAHHAGVHPIVDETGQVDVARAAACVHW
jgi:hypothetical protein